MKKHLFILIFCLIATSSMAATYYFDATSGNDANNGLTTGTAWQTFNNLDRRELSPGDNYLFKCGEKWDFNTNAFMEEINLNGGGTEGNLITISRYGDCTGENDPLFDGTVQLDDDALGTDAWAEYDTNIWVKRTSAAGMPSVERVKLDGIDYIEAANVASISETRRWDFVYPDLYLYSTQSPPLEYTTITVFGPEQFFDWINPSYVTVSHIHFKGGKYNFRCSGTYSNFTYENNYHEMYGKYGFQMLGYVTDITIQNNIISSDYNPYAPFEDHPLGNYDGINFQQGILTNAYIRYNTFTKMGHGGIGIDYSLVGDNSNVIIEHNIFDNSTMASSYSRAFGMGADNSYFRYNYIDHQNVRSQLGGHNNKVYNNIYNVSYNSPRSTTILGREQCLGLAATSTETQGNEIYNNVFYHCFMGGIRLLDTAESTVIKNNIFVGSEEENAYVQQIQYRDTNISEHYVSNNYFDTNLSENVIRADLESRWYTIADAEDVYPDYIANNFVGTIPFMDETFHSLESSLLIDNGADVSSVVKDDYDGNPRPLGAGFDIGAYESGTPPTPVTQRFNLEGVSLSGIGIGN